MQKTEPIIQWVLLYYFSTSSTTGLIGAGTGIGIGNKIGRRTTNHLTSFFIIHTSFLMYIILIIMQKSCKKFAQYYKVKFTKKLVKSSVLSIPSDLNEHCFLMYKFVNQSKKIHTMMHSIMVCIITRFPVFPLSYDKYH